MKDKNFLIHKMFAEFIGTFALVFFGCGSIMVADAFPNSVDPHLIPVIFGLVIACMIYAVGHISGAHFNPAVTLAFALVKHFPKREVAAYWVSQITAGILASSLLTVLLPYTEHYGASVPAVPEVPAFFWEIILSFFLMFVIMAVATDTRAVGFMAGIAIGGYVALAAFVGGPVTGASMNPARSIGPAIFEYQLDSIWLYILAPCIGTVIGAVSYRKIKCETQDDERTHKAKGCC